MIVDKIYEDMIKKISNIPSVDIPYSFPFPTSQRRNDDRESNKKNVWSTVLIMREGDTM